MTAIRPAGPGVAVGLHALGIANGSKPEVLATVARRADEVGFATLWWQAATLDVLSRGRFALGVGVGWSAEEPIRDRKLPVIAGGTTDAALARVAAFGDGWYAFIVAEPPAEPDDAAD